MRCLSLATYIRRNQDSEILFLSNPESEEMIRSYGFSGFFASGFFLGDLQKILKLSPHLVIFDSYLASETYLQQLNARVPLLLFDDNNDLYPSCPASFILNGNIHAPHLGYSPKNSSTRLLLGPEFLVMKPEYWKLGERGKRKPTPDLDFLITTGGSDPFSLFPQLLGLLQGISQRLQLGVVLGPGIPEKKRVRGNSRGNDATLYFDSPNSLKPLILRSRIVLCASGSTVYEVLRLGKIPLIFSFVPNQMQIHTCLQASGVPSLGYWEGEKPKTPSSEMQGKILETYSQRSILQSKLSPLFALFDGQGVSRVHQEVLTEMGTR